MPPTASCSYPSTTSTRSAQPSLKREGTQIVPAPVCVPHVLQSGYRAKRLFFWSNKHQTTFEKPWRSSRKLTSRILSDFSNHLMDKYSVCRMKKHLFILFRVATLISSQQKQQLEVMNLLRRVFYTKIRPQCDKCNSSKINSFIPCPISWVWYCNVTRANNDHSQ